MDVVCRKRAMPQPDEYPYKKVCLDADGRFFEALDSWSLEDVANALACQADPNIIVSADGSTPLHVAIRVGDIPMVRLLLFHGANINATNQLGETPLHLALWRQLSPCSDRLQNAALVQVVLEKKPIADVSDAYGWTPLHLAAMVADVDTVKWLMGKNVRKDPQNFRGQTPLHVATRNGRQEDATPAAKCDHSRVVAGFIMYGASETIHDNNGWSYEDYMYRDVRHLTTYQEEWALRLM